MKTVTYTLPDFWACPLINGDESGLEDEDMAPLDAFIDWHFRQYGSCHCISVEDVDGYFERSHDAERFGVLACNCLEFTFDITPTEA